MRQLLVPQRRGFSHERGCGKYSFLVTVILIQGGASYCMYGQASEGQISAVSTPIEEKHSFNFIVQVSEHFSISTDFSTFCTAALSKVKSSVAYSVSNSYFHIHFQLTSEKTSFVFLRAHHCGSAGSSRLDGTKTARRGRDSELFPGGLPGSPP